MIDVLYMALRDVYALDDTPFRLLHYTTFRMFLALVTAFGLTFWISPRVIATLYRRGIRDRVRTYDSSFSGSKTGTPTMGGLIIMGSLLTSVLLWCNPRSHIEELGGTLASAIPLLIMTLLFFGGIGALDDLLKVKRGGADAGLSRKVKLLLQTTYAVLFAILMLSDGTSPFPVEVRCQLYLPGIPANVIAPPDLGLAYGLLITLAFLGIANAINFADGLDGLAIAPSAMTILVFGVFAYVFSHAKLADITGFAHLEHMNEVAVFSAAFLGAALGFLWFNSYPAQVFMGDTGSMAIGGTCAALAVITKAELLFFLVGGIFVYEFLSVFIQDVVGIRRIGRRLMFRAPAHHGFQHQGIAETKVVLRFWIVSFILAAISIATLKLR